MTSYNSKPEAIINCYMIPKLITYHDIDPDQLKYPGQQNPIEDAIQISKPSTIDGYSPRNNKLLTYPYRYLLISNNSGSSNILHYERWDAVTCNFMVKGVPTCGGSIKLVPMLYDGQLTGNEDEGLMAGKFPTLSWVADPYTNWLTQNSVNIGIGVASAGINIVGGIASATLGGPAGVALGGSMIISGLSGITQTLGQMYQHDMIPNSAKGNVNGGDINTCSDKNGFTFYHMSIKQEYARIIDDYFSLFGYKIARVKVPNITGRQNWNYVKTIDCNFSGNIPQTDLDIIKNMFNNGVTFWHNPSTMYNYNNTNNIV